MEIDYTELFNSNVYSCPWREPDGTCSGMVSYNQHVNDPRYATCSQHICPAFYWAQVLSLQTRAVLLQQLADAEDFEDVG